MLRNQIFCTKCFFHGGSSANKDVYLNNVKDNSKYFNVLQYQQEGGEIKRLYKNFFDGADKSEKAEKAYDKLNRVYYSKAKEKNMTAPNYILTYVLKDS